MLVYAIAIAVAILIVPLTGGQLGQLGRIRVRRLWMLFGGLGLQILLEVVNLPRAHYDDVGLAILLASYVLIIGFGLSNLLITGMGVITVGIALNAFVIALNEGMPYRVPEGVTAETTVKHRPEKTNDILPELGDYIALGSPVNASISFGDLIIAVGLVDLTFRASRRPRRSRTRTPHPSEDDEIDLNALQAEESAAAAAAVAAVSTSSGPARDPQLGVAPGDPLQRVEHPWIVDIPRP